jgi:hypothetical protein
MTQAFNLSQLANNLNTSGQLDATDGLTGVVPDANLPTISASKGGTGQTSLTANNVLLGNGTSAVQFVAPSTNGNVLTSNGTTWVSSAVPSSAPTTAQVLSAYAGATANGVGTYSMASNVGVASNTSINGTRAGSQLQNQGAYFDQSGQGYNFDVGGNMSGTWKSMTGDLAGNVGANRMITLWMRVS